jgi:hypothetical protein
MLVDINAFYMFFKLRCPKGDMHEWTNNSCNKCKLSDFTINNAFSSKITDEVTNYYDKYLNIFIKENNENIIKNKHFDFKKDNKKNRILINSSNWKYNYSSIINVSKLLNVNPNIIESIGLYEGRTYKDIENNFEKPEIEIYHIYTTYSELINLCSLLKINIINLDDVDLSLSDTHKFIINKICDYILASPNQQSIEILEKILHNQKLFSIPEINTGDVLNNEDIIYIGDDIGDSGEDLRKTQYTKDNFYSSKNIDYDFSEDNPNNEPNIEIPNEYIYSIV